MKLTRKKLIELLTTGTAHVEVQKVDALNHPGLVEGTAARIDVTDDVKADVNMTQAALDALTKEVPEAYRLGFLTDQAAAETKGEKAIPVPGTTTWAVYLMTNADRIPVKKQRVTSGGSYEKVTYLADLKPHEQAEKLIEWQNQQHTPESEPHLLKVNLTVQTQEEAKRWKPGEDLSPDALEDKLKGLGMLRHVSTPGPRETLFGPRHHKPKNPGSTESAGPPSGRTPPVALPRAHGACPKCGGTDLVDASQSIDCNACGHSW